MKNLKYIVLLIAISFINCERDDICAYTTSTTPRLIIEFYDTDNPDDLKDVPRLTVYGEGIFTDEDGITTEPTESSDSIVEVYDESDTIDDAPSYVFNVNTDIIALPLKLTDDLGNNFITTRFILEKDTNLRIDGSGESNIDILEIRYSTDFVYVSRACGYKSTFINLGVSRDSTLDDDTWIRNIIIEESIESTVENENTTHVRIYH
ncbi:DUF6452 family protein [Winogradskyella endarachnes]|uniref:Uncharacterized protein n=1 Tax=Winogradskyella endarachnes TaxID=2681965 RepID=A0A6L6U763_9FLAO|nr:DUF6452 family protein [Winogradskyella endarachnes]MUU77436.1 hypothetical protein [Winogradskyella endarachnes]